MIMMTMMIILINYDHAINNKNEKNETKKNYH